MTASTQYHQRFQNRAVAEKYAQRFETGSRKKIDRREQRAVASIFSELNDCRSVLDVPSGAGRFVAALLNKDRTLIEMDVAHEMLAISRDRAADRSHHPHFVQGDASRLPLADASVDCVFCNRLLHHITSPSGRSEFLRELHRVSRKYVVVSFFDYLALSGIRRRWNILTGRKNRYDGQPTFPEFQNELESHRFRVMRVVPTGPFWVSEKYFLLAKS